MKNLYLSNMICGDVYPDNKPGEFINYLNRPLKLDGSWSVALNEMYHVPHTWHNIRYPGNVIRFKLSSSHPHVPQGSFDAEVAVGNYVDILDGGFLLGNVIYAMNLAIR